MKLPIPLSYPPMEALSVERIPAGGEWLYEPKWDGFRCIAFRDRAEVALQSKSGQPLARYFPDVVEALKFVKVPRFVLDGEIVVPVGRELSFDDLLQRIHPAESRIRKRAAESPALFVVFDLLVDEKGKSLTSKALRQRRPKLEAFAKKFFSSGGGVRLSPATPDVSVAKKWLSQAGGALDGVVAKRMDFDYDSGSGDEQACRRSSCCARGLRVGASATRRREVIGSLLLASTTRGLLTHVGFCSGLTAELRKRLKRNQENRRAAGLHRECSGWREPLEYEALRGMATLGSQGRRRGAVRPLHRRTLPPRDPTPAFPPRQGAPEMHLGPGRAIAPKVSSGSPLEGAL